MAGVVREVLVKRGEKVSAGHLILQLEVRAPEGQGLAPAPVPPLRLRCRWRRLPRLPHRSLHRLTRRGSGARSIPDRWTVRRIFSFWARVPGLSGGVSGGGSGPAGDAGRTGSHSWGVCLNAGCIPSKALLHAAKVIDEAEGLAVCGVTFGPPQIDVDALRGWKDRVIGKLTGGLAALAKQRAVTLVKGTGRFLSAHHLEVSDGEERRVIGFKTCVIAAGSESVKLPGFPDDPRIMDSAGALALKTVPPSLLVVGGESSVWKWPRCMPVWVPGCRWWS